MIISERLKQGRDPNQAIVYFDFDGTLTTKDSFMPFLRHCVGNTHYYLKLLRVAPTLAGYLLGWIKNDIAKQNVLSAYLKDWQKADLQQKANIFANEHIVKMQLSQGMQKLHEHQQKGDYCILVSASPELYLLPWAKQHGFDGLLATNLQYIHDKLTGQIVGKNCFGEEKVLRIEQEYGADCWINSYAYSDSKVDLPMLLKVNHGFLLIGNQFKLIEQ